MPLHSELEIIDANGVSLGTTNALQFSGSGQTSVINPDGSTTISVSGGSSGTVVSKQLTIQVLEANILSGSITLPETPPDPINVQISVVGGCQQRNATGNPLGGDFTVFGNELIWSGQGLETAITANDWLVVEF